MENIIAEVIKDFFPDREIDNSDVLNALETSASNIIPNITAMKLLALVNKDIISCFDLKINPKSTNLTGDLQNAIIRSNEKLKIMLSSQISESEIKKLEQSIFADFQISLSNGSWKKEFPGRKILSDFVDKFVNSGSISINYLIFRNAIIAKMRERQIKPSGIAAVIKKIVKK